MAELVQGLRPERNNTSVKRKEGRATVERAKESTARLSPSAGRVQSYAGNVAASQDNRGLALAKSLGALSDSLNRYADVRQKNVDRDIMDSAQYHIDNIKKEAGTDIVSRVQIGEMLPEASAIVTAKLAQAMGSQYAKEAWKPALEAIESDDTLRLDTQARNAYLEEFRSQLKGASQDPFYLNGLVASMEAEISQNEDRWLKETAQYHKDIIQTEYENEVVNRFINGESLEQWDMEANQSGPFVNTERNAIVVKALTAYAVETQDETVLSKIPDRFLNAETKRALAITQQQIKQARWTEFTQQKTLEEYQRKEAVRNGQIAIIQEFLDTGRVDTRKYRNNPELFAYATSMATAPVMDSTTSVFNAQRIRSGVLKVALTGDTEGALGSLGYTGKVTEDGLYNFVLNNTDMNPAEKQQLLGEIPKLLEGQALIQNPMVRDYMNTYLRPQLDSLRRSPNQKIQELLDGTNLEAQVIAAYEDSILRDVMSSYTTDGQYPTNIEMNGIVKQAKQDAIELMQVLTKVENTGMTVQEAQSGAVIEVTGFDAEGNPIYNK